MDERKAVDLRYVSDALSVGVRLVLALGHPSLTDPPSLALVIIF